jgi:hypothetical protein
MFEQMFNISPQNPAKLSLSPGCGVRTGRVLSAGAEGEDHVVIRQSIPAPTRGNRHLRAQNIAFFRQPVGYPGNTPPVRQRGEVIDTLLVFTQYRSMEPRHLSNTAPLPIMENTRGIWSPAAGYGEFGDFTMLFHFHHFHRIHRLRRQQNRTTTTTTTTRFFVFYSALCTLNFLAAALCRSR